MFVALEFAAIRDPKILSILASLNNYPHLIGGQNVVSFLIRANFVFVAAVGVLSVLLAWKLRLHWLEASALGLLAVFATYKVGHQQFYLAWLFLVAALPLAGTRSCRQLEIICIPFILFLSVFQWGYAYGSDNYHQISSNIRRDVGFFAFGLSVTTIAVYFAVAKLGGGKFFSRFETP
jgi:hypothetical protein